MTNDRIINKFNKLSIPKNKTGLFVSEIITRYIRQPSSSLALLAQKQQATMNDLLNRTGENRTHSNLDTELLNAVNETIEYRNHSALRIKVKPRVQLTSANNLKLADYLKANNSNKYQNYKHSHLSTVSSKSNEDFYDSKSEMKFPESTPIANNNNQSNSNEKFVEKDSYLIEETVDAYYLITKDAFRPSNIKRRLNKTPLSDDQQYKGPERLSSRANTLLSTQSNNNEVTSSNSQRSGLNNNNKMALSNETSTLNERASSNLNESENGERNRSVKFSAISNRPQSYHVNTANNKTTYDLFKEILDLASNIPTNSAITTVNNHKYKLIRSKSFLDSNSYLDIHDNYEKSNNKENDDEFSIEQSNKIIKNLNENEFLEFLKEYRKTKSINLSNINKTNETTLSQTVGINNENIESKGNAAAIGNGGHSKANTQLKIPCHLIPSSNGGAISPSTLSSSTPGSNLFPLLTPSSNSNPTITNKLPLTKSSNLNTSNFIVLNNNETINNLSQLSNNTNGSNNFIVNKTTPSYLVNYLNKKLSLKNQKCQIVDFLIKDSSGSEKKSNHNKTMTNQSNKNGGFTFDELNIKSLNLNNNSTNNSSPNSSNKLNKKNLKCLKVLNFPEVAN